MNFTPVSPKPVSNIIVDEIWFLISLFDEILLVKKRLVQPLNIPTQSLCCVSFKIFILAGSPGIGPVQNWIFVGTM